MENFFRQEMVDRMYRTGAIAVLVIDDAKNAVPLAEALLEGGIDIMELTLRTPAAIEALVEIRRTVPDMMCGVGTVLTTDQVVKVADAGASFAVAPGFNPNVVKKARDCGLPFSPGIVTPSEIEGAVDLGCTILKYFPAEPSGGLKYLKSMSNPYDHLKLRYIPLGGLNQDNLEAYLRFPSVLAVGGSWIAKRALIQNREWGNITKNAGEAARVIKKLRGV